MPSSTKLIDQNLFDQAVSELQAIGKYAKTAIKLQSIISSKEHNILQTAKFLGLDRTSIIRWIKRFKKDGIAGLEDKDGRGRKSIFTKEIKIELKKIIEHDHCVTLKKLKIEIEKKFNIKCSKSALHNQVRILGYRNITRRPQHYKQEEEKLVEFKKKANRNQRTKSK
jgi:transposase